MRTAASAAVALGALAALAASADRPAGPPGSAVWWAFRPLPGMTQTSLHDPEAARLLDRRGSSGRRDPQRSPANRRASRPIQPLRKPPGQSGFRAPRAPRENTRTPLPNPIDRFIDATLRMKGLTPNGLADRRTLIRRVTHDLTGLPPTPEEVEAFLKDRSPDAWEKVVDRLLASPRYGERWARHWLDVVHYADTHGYDKDKRRDNAWPYRDYVIRSLNQDKPWSRFVKEQIAGDVLYPDDPDGIVATGFVVAGPWDFVGHVELAEGTVEKAKTRSLDRDDMVQNAISAFCSVTVGCARCHDHKFDPIPMRDYYRLQAVFAGVQRADRPYGDPRLIRWRAQTESRRDALRVRLTALEKNLESLRNPEVDALDREIEAIRAQLARAESPSNGWHSAIEPRPDAAKWVQADLGRQARLESITLVPARPTDFPDTPGFGFPVRFRVDVSTDGVAWRIVEDRSAADFPNPGDTPHRIAMGGDPVRFIRVTALRLWPRRAGDGPPDYVFALAELQARSPAGMVPVVAVTAMDSIEAGRWSTRFLADGFDSRRALGDGQTGNTPALEEQLAALRATRARAAEGLIPPEARAERERVSADLARIEEELRAQPAPPKVYAVAPREPHAIHILSRGDVEQPGERVGPGALSCIPGLRADFGPLPSTGPSAVSHPAAPGGARPDEGAARAALAEWIASPRNPLTWRSVVNRVWHYHFGRGIVETPNDFGRMGSLPTHPELLDWLAASFLTMDGERGTARRGLPASSRPPAAILPLNQSLKRLHRLIVTSKAYRRSSRDNPANSRLDADNRFLWRANRQRLDAESLRDAVLSVSGSLDLAMGGPGFELFRFKDDHSPVYDHADLEKARDPRGFRRTIYRFVVRSVPNPFLECLDCADPNISTPVRSTTLTALQALALLNDPFMLDQAGRFAQRLERQVAGDSSRPGVVERRVEAAFQLALCRPPSPSERASVADYARRHSLAAACRLLLNTNEFAFID